MGVNSELGAVSSIHRNIAQKVCKSTLRIIPGGNLFWDESHPNLEIILKLPMNTVTSPSYRHSSTRTSTSNLEKVLFLGEERTLFPDQKCQDGNFCNLLSTSKMLRVFISSTKTIYKGSDAILGKILAGNKILIDSS
jgi:hypothetical protein